MLETRVPIARNLRRVFRGATFAEDGRRPPAAWKYRKGNPVSLPEAVAVRFSFAMTDQ